MKKRTIYFILLFNVSTHFVNAQIKPRFVKSSLTVCPFDYSSLNGNNNFATSNNRTLSISAQRQETIFAREGFTIGSIQVSNGQQLIVTRYDTSFLQRKIVSNTYAFNVIGNPIGSYSVIRFWQLKKSNNAINVLQSLDSNVTRIPIVFKYIKASETRKMGYDSAIASDVNDFDGYYLVKTSELLTNTVEFDNKKNQWNIGFLVVPVKLRPFATESGHFDFNNGFSLGPTFSWTLCHKWNNDKTFNLLFYPGVSSIPVSKEMLKSSDTTTKNIAAFSPAVGIMLQKGLIQLSLLIGMDFPAGQTQKNWVYRNMPWFGFGIGFSIFKVQEGNNSNTGNNSK